MKCVVLSALQCHSRPLRRQTPTNWWYEAVLDVFYAQRIKHTGWSPLKAGRNHSHRVEAEHAWWAQNGFLCAWPLIAIMRQVPAQHRQKGMLHGLASSTKWSEMGHLCLQYPLSVPPCLVWYSNAQVPTKATASDAAISLQSCDRGSTPPRPQSRLLVVQATPLPHNIAIKILEEPICVSRSIHSKIPLALGGGTHLEGRLHNKRHNHRRRQSQHCRTPCIEITVQSGWCGFAETWSSPCSISMLTGMRNMWSCNQRALAIASPELGGAWRIIYPGSPRPEMPSSLYKKWIGNYGRIRNWAHALYTWEHIDERLLNRYIWIQPSSKALISLYKLSSKFAPE